MKAYVNPPQIQLARSVPLAKYLAFVYPESFVIEPFEEQCSYLNHPVSVNQDLFRHFPVEIAGNPIDFLMKYLGYTFVSAVKELDRFADSPQGQEVMKGNQDSQVPQGDIPQSLDLPKPLSGQYRQLFGFMNNRKIPFETVKMLVNVKLLYQEAEMNNAVFVSRDSDYMEVMGTVSYRKKPYFRVHRLHEEAHWSVTNGTEAPRHLYICESAMEAVSLMLLQQRAHMNMPAEYVSIGDSQYFHGMHHLACKAKQNEIHPFLAMGNCKINQLHAEMLHIDFVAPKTGKWNSDLVAGYVYEDPIYAPKSGRSCRTEKDIDALVKESKTKEGGKAENGTAHDQRQ